MNEKQHKNYKFLSVDHGVPKRAPHEHFSCLQKRVVLKAAGNAMHGCSSLFPKKISTVCENWHEWCTDCVDMTAPGQKTRVTLDVPHAATICHQVEQSLCQKIGKIDKLHEEHETLRTIRLLLETRMRIPNLDWIRTRFLLEICKIPNQPQAESRAYLDHEQVFQFPRCARSKQQFLTAVSNQK